MITADRKRVVHNAYWPTPNIAEIKDFVLFACVLFPCICMMVYYQAKNLDRNERTKTAIEEQNYNEITVMITWILKNALE